MCIDAIATRRLPTLLFILLLFSVAPTTVLEAKVRADLGLPQNRATLPRVNAPYFNGEITFAERAIFWFGQVTPTSNYADVRVGYNDEVLVVESSIFDRQLWNDESPSSNELTDWDAVTLYLSREPEPSETLSSTEHQIVIQFNPFNLGDDYLATYQGSSNGWQPSTHGFSSFVGWRGLGHNNEALDASGWRAAFIIPFSEVGLAAPPTAGSLWRLGLTLHDRDDAAGTAIPDQSWPPAMDADQPATWASLHFGRPASNPPSDPAAEVITITDGVDGATVVDAHVGGHSICGGPYHPNFFDGWGDANYAGYAQINIQNQSDVADWPCFSKYYITFPLDSLPADSTVLAAALTMHQFGNADPSSATPSLIQAMTVADVWDEATITWNNAPLAMENVAETWVGVITDFNAEPVPYRWDVGAAVTAARQANQPLRLVLYSADSDYHSGKYFWASGTDPAVQPRLEVTLGVAESTATPEPEPSATSTPLPPASPTETALPATATQAATEAATQAATAFPTNTPTAVPSTAPTEIPGSTQTVLPVSTSTNSPTATPMITSTPNGAAETQTVTATATTISQSSVTPSAEFTATIEPGGTVTLPTEVPTQTPTRIPTAAATINAVHLPYISGTD